MALPSGAGAMAPKLHGRAFYESIGSPKLILAPMVDASEFAWRMLTRSFLNDSQSKMLAYTPMLHSRLFSQDQKYRRVAFEPTRTTWPNAISQAEISTLSPNDWYLDGNPAIDRPLIVQFCSNAPDHFLEAAKYVEPFCDAVDLNLGCPQGIARKGHFGAFLQEDQDLISRLINRLHTELSVPVTAKMRILRTKEETLAYAQKILSAGASILTVHGRQRDQKGHNTGLADWSVIRYLRENLPKDTVLFANGNILQRQDIEKCLDATGADGVMVAEANLHDPSVFAAPPATGENEREYWCNKEGIGGYRMDAVFRRYMNIIYKYVLDQEPPMRPPLYIASDPDEPSKKPAKIADAPSDGDEPHTKRRKTSNRGRPSPNIHAMQSHLFNLLRPLVSKHTHVRDALAKCRCGNIEAYENVLGMVEQVIRQGLIDYEGGNSGMEIVEESVTEDGNDPTKSSVDAIKRCRRPWWVCQPYVRPLPAEALAKGAIKLSKKEEAKLAQTQQVNQNAEILPIGRQEQNHVNGTNGETAPISKDDLVSG